MNSYATLTEALQDVAEFEGANRAARDRVLRGGENSVDHPVTSGQISGVGRPLDLVEVEGELSGDGAVEPGLDEGRPPVLVALGTPGVILAHPGHPGVDRLPAVDVLNSSFAEKEINVVSVLHGADEVGS